MNERTIQIKHISNFFKLYWEYLIVFYTWTTQNQYTNIHAASSSICCGNIRSRSLLRNQHKIVVEISCSSHGQHETNMQPTFSFDLSSGRNIRAGSTLYGILGIKWGHSSIAHINHYYIGL